MNAIRYIVDTLLWLLLLAFVLRLLFQLARADFRDPIADAVVRVTNWLVLPLRRILPPAGKVDTATVVSILLIAAARTCIIFLLSAPFAADALALYAWAAVRSTLVELIEMVLKIYLFALLLYWLISFISPGGPPPGTRLLGQLCEPVLRPVRRIIPPIGQIDFSVLWVSILIGAALILVR